jgi:phage terminase large subunit
MPPLANATDQTNIDFTGSLTEAVDNVLRWRPNPGKQERALRIPDSIFEILYGGARGGGKTDAGIYWTIKPVARMGNLQTIRHPYFRCLVLRRSAKDLNDWLDRAERVYAAFGGRLTDRQKSPTFVFPSGAKIVVGHMKDVSSYLGHEYQRMLIEELTQLKDEITYTKLTGSCRSTIPEIKPQIFMTTNPGGKGHGWVRRRFVMAAPWDTIFLNPTTNRFAVFIPSRVEDNPKLVENDPGYVQWLEGIKHVDDKLYRMWREGEWDAFEGQVFSEWRAQLNGRPHHVFDQFWFDLNQCERIAAMDWGYRDPCSVHWIAKLPENQYGVQRLVIYREAYKTEVTAKLWGQLLGNISGPAAGIDKVKYLVLPNDAYSRRPEEGNTIEQILRRESGIKTMPAKNNAGSRLNRIALMHNLLSIAPDGYPYLMTHSSCNNFNRTVPELVYDETIVEDIDSDAEDHAFDSGTYGLMTMRPTFANRGLLVRTIGGPVTPANLGLQQNAQGEYVNPDLLQAAARPQMVPRGEAEA